MQKLKLQGWTRPSVQFPFISTPSSLTPVTLVSLLCIPVSPPVRQPSFPFTCLCYNSAFLHVSSEIFCRLDYFLYGCIVHTRGRIVKSTEDSRLQWTNESSLRIRPEDGSATFTSPSFSEKSSCLVATPLGTATGSIESQRTVKEVKTARNQFPGCNTSDFILSANLK